MNSKKTFGNFFMVVSIFLMIYRPALLPIISISDFMFVISFVGCIVCNNRKLSIKMFIPNREIKLFSYIMLAATFYSSFITVLAEGRWNYGYIYIKILLYSFVYSSFICCVLKKNHNGIKQLVDWLMLASVIQSVFVVVMLFNNSFRTRVITRLINNGALGITMERFLMYPQRSFGLGDGYWSGLGIVSGILADIAVVFALKYSKKYYCFVPGLLLTSVVNARTGIVVFVAGLIAIIFLYGGSSVKKRIGLLSLVLLVSFLLPFILNYLQTITPGTFRWITSATDHIDNMTEGEGSATYYKLNPKYWIWPGFFSTIFGTGKSIFGREGLSNFGYSSDSGYLGIIYRGGLILSFLLYYATYILCFSKKIRSSQYKIFGIIFLFSLIIQHYKGGVFYFNEYITLIIILVFAVYQIESVEQKN